MRSDTIVRSGAGARDARSSRLNPLGRLRITDRAFYTALIAHNEDDLYGGVMRSLFEQHLSKAVRRAANAFGTDIPLFVPRTPDDCTHRYSAWIARMHGPFEERLKDSLSKELGQNLPKDSLTLLTKDLSAQVWPTLEGRLRLYAAQATGTRWAARHYPDSVGVGEPEEADGGWRLPLRVLSGQEVGQIRITDDGVVDERETTTLDQLRERIGRAQ